MKSDNLRLPVKPAMVWIDLDDTLIDFHANSRVALRMLYRQEHISQWIADEERWVADYERTNKELWRLYALGAVTKEYLRIERMRAPLRRFWTESLEALDHFANRLDPLYLDLLAEQKGLVEGALALLHNLRSRGYRIGVLSNGFRQVQYRKIESAGLKELIDVVVLSDDIGVNKPALAIYRHAMEVSGVMNPGRHLMIGDNADTDIAGALNAGWEAVLYDPGFSGKAKFDGTCFTVSSLGQIPALLP